jgi:hypothetical protein
VQLAVQCSPRCGIPRRLNRALWQTAQCAELRTTTTTTTAAVAAAAAVAVAAAVAATTTITTTLTAADFAQCIYTTLHHTTP